ncbi:MAG TPA: hypothetical protein VFE32_17485 [Puia sp.]|jgi:hypothetical protein|nr:hypothetical protein [Puia sp.]
MKMLKSILTGPDGTLSSKRVILFLAMFTFIAVVLVNLYDHTRVLQADLQSQLYQFLVINISLVFGDSAIPAIKGTLGKFGLKDPDTAPDQAKP